MYNFHKKCCLIIGLAAFLASCSQSSETEEAKMAAAPKQSAISAMAKAKGLNAQNEELKLSNQIAAKSQSKKTPPTSWLPTSNDQYTVLFDLNSNALNNVYKGELVSFAQYLSKHPEQKIHVDGFTCELGSSEYNVALGQRRAYAVSKFLESKGVDSRQIILVSYGKERPADPAHNEIAWTKNRRVEVFF